MNYTVQSGDIIFYKGHSWADWLIKNWTNSEYVHCAIAIDSDRVIAATTSGIKIQPLGEYDTVWTYASYAIENNEAFRVAGMLWLNKQVGTGYSWTDIFSQAINKVIRGTYVYSNREYDCSELCVRFLMHTRDFDLGDLVDYPNQATPGSLIIDLFKLHKYR